MDKKIIWIVAAVVVVLILVGGAGAGAVYFLAKRTANTLTLSTSPTPCTNCGNSPSPSGGLSLEEIKASHCLKSPSGGTGNITIASIGHYAAVDSPILVEGTANVFEGSFMIRLVDCDGKKINEVNAQTEPGEVGVSNPYFVNISYNDSYLGTFATLEAYDLSAMDGSMQNLIQVPVYLK